MTDLIELLPCPFCGGAVRLEQPVDRRTRDEWWGVVCRNTTNLGGTCAIEQRASRTKEAAIARWNRRAALEAVSPAPGEARLPPGWVSTPDERTPISGIASSLVFQSGYASPPTSPGEPPKGVLEALKEARAVVDAVAGENQPARAWAREVRTRIDAAIANAAPSPGSAE